MTRLCRSLFANRRGRIARRRGMMLCDLLFASALAFSAAFMVLQSASSMVRQNTAAARLNKDAWTLAALVEEAEANGEESWSVEIERERAGGRVILNNVTVTGGRGGSRVNFMWRLRGTDE